MNQMKRILFVIEALLLTLALAKVSHAGELHAGRGPAFAALEGMAASGDVARFDNNIRKPASAAPVAASAAPAAYDPYQRQEDIKAAAQVAGIGGGLIALGAVGLRHPMVTRVTGIAGLCLMGLGLLMAVALVPTLRGKIEAAGEFALVGAAFASTLVFPAAGPWILMGLGAFAIGGVVHDIFKGAKQ